MIKKLLISLFILGIAWGQSNGIKPPLGTQLDKGNRLTKSLVGAWYNQEAAPAIGTLYDISGNGNYGTLVGDTHSVPGPDGPALDFDGDEDYVDVANSPELFGMSQLTLILLARYTGVESVIEHNLIDAWDPGNQCYLLRFDDAATDNEIQFFTRNAISGQVGGGFANTDMSDQQWHHIAAVYDGVNNCVYFDGVLSPTSLPQTGTLYAASTILRIGGQQALANDWWTGQIDSVLIYNRALSASEIEELYQDRNILFKTQNIALMASVDGAPPAEVGQLIMIMGSVPLIVVFVAFSFWYSGRKCDDEVDEQ